MDNIGKLLENYMVSNLANIISARPRQAENTDARLDIKRHDPDQERRKKDDEDDTGKIKFDTYDNAVVSVDALRVFLENFLKSLTAEEPGIPAGADGLAAQGFSSDEINTPENESRPVSAAASHAANVYQAGAKTKPRPAPPPPENKNETTGQNPGLANEDVRTIHELLRGISVLQARGIEYLTIEKNETFLASLATAVQKAVAP